MPGCKAPTSRGLRVLGSVRRRDEGGGNAQTGVFQQLRGFFRMISTASPIVRIFRLIVVDGDAETSSHLETRRQGAPEFTFKSLRIWVSFVAVRAAPVFRVQLEVLHISWKIFFSPFQLLQNFILLRLFLPCGLSSRLVPYSSHFLKIMQLFTSPKPKPAFGNDLHLRILDHRLRMRGQRRNLGVQHPRC